MSKILTVFGATGNQGSSVIASVLKNPTLSTEYKIRGVTRDPSKPAAQALHKRGVELVKADLTNKESVREAVKGSYAVFGVTNYWELVSKDAEMKQGKNIADACKDTGVKHLIWSSLPNATQVSDGKLKHMPHFDAKAEVEDYIRALGVPSTFVLPACFMQNIKGSLQKTDNGYALAWNVHADTPVPLIDAQIDTGNFVAAVLLKPNGLFGRQIFAASGWYTPNQIVSTTSEVSGKKMSYTELSDEIFQSFLPQEMAREFAETFKLINDHAYYGKNAQQEVAEAQKILVEKPTTLTEWAEKNGPW